MSRILVLSFLVVSLATSTLAQQPDAGGRIAGTVTDQSGGVVLAQVVDLRSLDAAVVRQATTDHQGRYEFGELPPGRYSISTRRPGFQPAVRLVVVRQAGTSAVDLVLALAAQDARVEVTAHGGDRPLRVDTDPQRPRQPIPAQDGADYLKTIPGFSVIRKGGTDGDPVLRGMAGSRLGILLDGQNLLGGCSSRMDPPTAYVFPDAYDSITVLKGPQSVAHGPGNSAGVVLFERDLRPETGVSLYAAPTVGSFGRNDEAATVRVGGSRAYLRSGVTRSSMGNYLDGSGGQVHSEYERWSVDTAVGLTPNADTLIEISTTLSDGEAAYADRMMDGARFARRNLGLRFERRNLPGMMSRLEGQAYVNHVDHVMDNYSLRPFTPTMMMPGQTVSNPDRRTVGGRLAAALSWATATTASVGVDWQNNRHAVRNSSNQLVDPFEDKVRVQDAAFSDVGVFGEVTHARGTRLRVIGGGRVDRWSARDDRAMVTLGMAGTAANPTSGGTRDAWLPSGFGRFEQDWAAGATVFVGAGHTQRTPDYWELISQQSATSVSAFGASPEKTTQLDAGLLYRSTRVSGSVSMFASRIDDFLLVQSNYVRPMTAAGMNASPSMPMGGMMTTGMSSMAVSTATVTRNVDASSWGGEAAVTAEILPSVKLDTSLAYVRGENRTDNRPLAQLPPIEGRIGVQYSVARWSAGTLVRLVGAQTRYALNQGNIVGQDIGPTDAFAVFSLNGSVRVHRTASLSLGADNLLNTTYAEFISRAGSNVGGFPTTTRVNEPGRTLWARLEFRY